MGIYRSSCSVMRVNFHRWRSDRRIWIIFLFIGLLLLTELRGYVAYGLDSGEKCTAFLLPTLFASYANVAIGSMKMMLYLGCLLLLCDAPFIYQVTPYMVIRSRREGWWIGECMYILFTTFLYTVFIVIVSTIVVLPVATFGDAWGGVLKDFAYGNASMYPVELKAYYNIYLMSPTMAMRYLYPSGAQLYTFLTAWASFFFLGLVQYLVSLKSKSMFLGFVSAGVFVLIDPILVSASGSIYSKWAIMLSPVCWVDTNLLHITNSDKILQIPYVVTMFIILIVALLFAIRMVSKKIMIEVRGEV